MKIVLIFLIKIYQRTFGVWKGQTCVFYPTCSHYAKDVILKHGIIKGGYLSIRRVIRCHPWQKKHIDNP